MYSDKNSERLKVLLIEDNADDAEFLRESLQKLDAQDVELVSICTLKEALKTLALRHFDAVLLDLTLPDSSGLDSLRKLRLFSSELPIIVLTGLDDKALALESVKQGAQDYLVKGRPSHESLYRSITYSVERCRAEAAIKQLRLFEQREHFIAMLAHDLRNPIFGSERIISLILGGKLGTLTDEQQKMLSLVSCSHATLLQMINNVLDSYRLESGGENFNLIEVDLSMLLRDCMEAMKVIAESKRVRLTMKCSLPKFTIADPIAMRRVIDNLVSNAIKFTCEGGEVEILLDETENKARLQVRDNGIGISAEKQLHLFERFYQTERKNRSAGLGLGLNLCKHLVEAQNGSIHCRSQINVGTTFEITLPITAQNISELPVVNCEVQGKHPVGARG